MKISYILLLLLLTCCKRNSIEKIIDSKDIANIEIKEFTFDDNKIFDSNKYFDSVKYVFFEETDELIVPSIEDIFFTDSLFIVVSKRASSIFFFNVNGKYLHKISKRGRGNGEYLSQEKVMVDEKRKEVMVYDDDANKILYYDFNGNFLKAINNFSNNALVRDIINTSDGGFICYNYDFYDDKEFPAGLWKVDSCGKFNKFIYKLNEYYPSRSSYGLTNLAHLKGDTIGFFDSNTTRTYHLINDTLFCRSRYKMPDKTKADYVGVKETEDKYMPVFDYHEKGNYIFMTWGTADGRIFQTVLSKSDNTIETGLWFNPIMENYIMLGGMNINNNRPNIFTSWMDYETLKAVKEQHQDSIIRSGMKNLFKTVPQTTNIIIQITYVKN